MVKAGVVRSDRLAGALRRLDRGQFAAPYFLELPPDAYENKPFPLGFGANMSAPALHAQVLELLAPVLVPGGAALDVGCGTGYVSAVMALLVEGGSPAEGRGQAGGRAVGVDRAPPLVQRAAVAARAAGFGRLLDEGVLTYRTEDAGGGAAAGTAPALFDAIYVGCAVPEAAGVAAFTAQLAPRGRLVVPVGEGSVQRLIQVDRSADGSAFVETYVSATLCQPMLPGLLDPAASAADGEGPSAAAAGAASAASTPKHPEAVRACLYKPDGGRFTRREAAARLAQALATWSAQFAAAHRGAKPTRADIAADPVASVLFAEFQEQSRKGW